MYQTIIKNLSDDSINFFWAHNHHVDSLEYHDYNMEYIENKSHKWYCGYYLKQKLKDKYCIILTQAYEGTNRFNGYCSGKNCEKRTWKLKYFYKKFIYNPNKKYAEATIDHIHPQAKGGKKYDESNLCVACRKCNERKADTDRSFSLNLKVSAF